MRRFNNPSEKEEGVSCLTKSIQNAIPFRNIQISLKLAARCTTASYQGAPAHNERGQVTMDTLPPCARQNLLQNPASNSPFGDTSLEG